MDNLEPILLAQENDADSLNHLGHQLVEMREKLNEAIGVNAVRPDFQDGERCIVVPTLVNGEILVSLLMNDCDCVSDVEKVLGSIHELLLNLHSPGDRVVVHQLSHVNFIPAN